MTDVASWFVVEAAATAVQFTIFGILLGVIHRERAVTVDVRSD